MEDDNNDILWLSRRWFVVFSWKSCSHKRHTESTVNEWVQKTFNEGLGIFKHAICPLNQDVKNLDTAAHFPLYDACFLSYNIVLCPFYYRLEHDTNICQKLKCTWKFSFLLRSPMFQVLETTGYSYFSCFTKKDLHWSLNQHGYSNILFITLACVW